MFSLLGWVSVFFSLLLLIPAIYLFGLFYFQKHRVLRNKKFDWSKDVPRGEYDRRRFETYPPLVPNTWYHIADSHEIKPGQVYHYKALGQSFAIWRTSTGKPVASETWCPHLGANLAVGGKVEDDCLVCPFHNWKFNESGDLAGIPYLPKETALPQCRPLRTFPAVDWCGLLCVYFHADKEECDWKLPASIQSEVTRSRLQLKWDIGYVKLSCIDWVDQAGDHAHFQTLHSIFLLPWSTIPFPAWFLKLFPVKLFHNSLSTYMGDETKFHTLKESPEMSDHDKLKLNRENDKHIMYFLDHAGPEYKGKQYTELSSSTLETYVGPAMMVFHVPLHILGYTFGYAKIFVTTTPVEGGSIMRVRTYASSSWLPVRFYVWLMAGVSASQLAADIQIMEDKVRLRKPQLTRQCGPFVRSNRWLHTFYSTSSADVGKQGFIHDW